MSNKFQWSFCTVSSFTSDLNITLGFGMKKNHGESVTVLKLTNIREKFKI